MRVFVVMKSWLQSYTLSPPEIGTAIDSVWSTVEQAQERADSITREDSDSIRLAVVNEQIVDTLNCWNCQSPVTEHDEMCGVQ